MTKITDLPQDTLYMIMLHITRAMPLPDDLTGFNELRTSRDLRDAYVAAFRHSVCASGAFCDWTKPDINSRLKAIPKYEERVLLELHVVIGMVNESHNADGLWKAFCKRRVKCIVLEPS